MKTKTLGSNMKRELKRERGEGKEEGQRKKEEKGGGIERQRGRGG